VVTSHIHNINLSKMASGILRKR